MIGGSAYESFFGVHERPFSLTSEPKYFFRSRSHGRALETLAFGLRRQEQFLLVTGDLGVGKTMLCHTLADQLRRRKRVSVLNTPLRAPHSFLRLLLEDFGALSQEEARALEHEQPSAADLHGRLERFMTRLDPAHEGGVIIVDEAQLLPPALVDQLFQLARLVHAQQKTLQVVLVGQGVAPHALGVDVLDELVSTKTCLVPLVRDECADYVVHRLTVAGASGAAALFTPRAIDTLYGLSGGVPRLVNLLCERALQEAAAANTNRIEPSTLESAASALQLLRSRRRRFRWYSRRVS